MKIQTYNHLSIVSLLKIIYDFRHQRGSHFTLIVMTKKFITYLLNFSFFQLTVPELGMYWSTDIITAINCQFLNTCLHVHFTFKLLVPFLQLFLYGFQTWVASKTNNFMRAAPCYTLSPFGKGILCQKNLCGPITRSLSP